MHVHSCIQCTITYVHSTPIKSLNKINYNCLYLACRHIKYAGILQCQMLVGGDSPQRWQCECAAIIGCTERTTLLSKVHQGRLPSILVPAWKRHCEFTQVLFFCFNPSKTPPHTYTPTNPHTHTHTPPTHTHTPTHTHPHPHTPHTHTHTCTKSMLVIRCHTTPSSPTHTGTISSALRVLGWWLE